MPTPTTPASACVRGRRWTSRTTVNTAAVASAAMSDGVKAAVMVKETRKTRPGRMLSAIPW
jgi:hypothetical protein